MQRTRRQDRATALKVLTDKQMLASIEFLIAGYRAQKKELHPENP
jgi:hypothetical protein